MFDKFMVTIYCTIFIERNQFIVDLNTFAMGHLFGMVK